MNFKCLPPVRNLQAYIDLQNLYWEPYRPHRDMICAYEVIIQCRHLSASHLVYSSTFVCLSQTARSDCCILQGDVSLTDVDANNCGKVMVRQSDNLGSALGTVCADFFDNQAATVVCRQLGLPGGKKHKRGLSNTPSPCCGQPQPWQPLWMDDVKCSGVEPTLTDCQHVRWPDVDCHTKEDAYVCCDKVRYNIHICTYHDLGVFMLWLTWQHETCLLWMSSVMAHHVLWCVIKIILSLFAVIWCNAWHMCTYTYTCKI